MSPSEVKHVGVAVLVDKRKKARVSYEEIKVKHVGVAQLVERGTHKPEVTGSFPVADTIGEFR
jgi:hypothetical protein